MICLRGQKRRLHVREVTAYDDMSKVASERDADSIARFDVEPLLQCQGEGIAGHVELLISQGLMLCRDGYAVRKSLNDGCKVVSNRLVE